MLASLYAGLWSFLLDFSFWGPSFVPASFFMLPPPLALASWLIESSDKLEPDSDPEDDEDASEEDSSDPDSDDPLDESDDEDRESMLILEEVLRFCLDATVAFRLWKLLTRGMDAARFSREAAVAAAVLNRLDSRVSCFPEADVPVRVAIIPSPAEGFSEEPPEFIMFKFLNGKK